MDARIDARHGKVAAIVELVAIRTVGVKKAGWGGAAGWKPG